MGWGWALVLWYLIGVSSVASSGPVQPQARALVRLSRPDWVRAGACTIEKDGLVVDRQEGREVTLQCPANGETVHCSFEGAEPFDLRLDTMCRTRTLPVQPARTITVNAAQPGQTTIDWLDITPVGRLTTIATRRVDFVGAMDIRVAESADRYVRFSRGDTSPATVAAADLPDHTPWTLPPFRPGGEVFGRLDRAAVLPESYRLSNSAYSAEVKRFGKQSFSLGGLPVGEYLMVPVYEGGLTGDPMTVGVEMGKSTAVFLKREEVGALEVSADQDICFQTNDLRLVRTRVQRLPSGDSAIARTAVLNLAPGGDCHRMIAGLTEGEYEVSFDSSSGPLEMKRFRIVSQTVVHVLVASSLARVSGAVLLNDKPASNLFVEFRPPTAPFGMPIVAQVGPSGQYEVNVGRAGEYTVGFRHGRVRLFGQDRHVTLVAGSNAFDWSLIGGSLTIAIAGWDHSTPLALEMHTLKSPGPGVSNYASKLDSSDPTPITIEGLGWGTYAVEARQFEKPSSEGNPVKMSSEKVVSIDKDHPAVDVDLELVENRAILGIHDEFGAVVPGVKIGGTPARLAEVEPGAFSLEGVKPGVPLFIAAPGFARTCRLAPREGRTDVILSQGRAVEVQFSRKSLVTGSLQLPGADCLMPLGEFLYTSLPTLGDAGSRFLFQDFPSGSSFMFVLNAAAQRVNVPSTGAALIKLPVGRHIAR